eukprot:TRINITY_DN21108_c0_g1_i1.p1 TRINITY_DN21108_c0_g1~~TRINITY_DN21108_c0_g1_i1.p1  ORF type:complete len:841 (+),score=249.37 TRINITY_DN21108_c0_g1_i1:65-2587(+)
MPQTAVGCGGWGLEGQVTCCAQDDGLIALGYSNGVVECWQHDRELGESAPIGIAAAHPLDHPVESVSVRNGVVGACCFEAWYWSVDEFVGEVDEERYNVVRVGGIDGLEGEHARHVLVSPYTSHVAVAYGRAVIVWDLAQAAAVALLEGHEGPVTSLLFSEAHHGVLYTASEDKTFKTWDFLEGCVQYQSPIVAPTAVIMSMVEQPGPTHRLAVGTSGGVVHIFDLDEGRCREVTRVDVAALSGKRAVPDADAAPNSHPQLKVVTSQPPWKQGQQPAAGPAEPVRASEMGQGVVALGYHVGREVLPNGVGGTRALPRSWFLVLTYHAIVAISADTLDATFLTPPDGIGAGGPCCVGAWRDEYVAACAPLARRVGVWRAVLNTQQVAPPQPPPPVPTQEPASVPPQGEGASGGSVFLRTPLPKHLATPLVPASAKPAPKPGGKSGGKGDKPILLRGQSSVRSSGYASSEPWSVKQARKKQQQQTAKRKGSAKADARPVYHTAAPPPTTVQKQHTEVLQQRPVHGGAVLACCFASDAKTLLTAGADRTACLLRLPVAKNNGEASVFKAHTAPVCSAALTYTHGDYQALLTGGLDSSVMLWRPKHDTPLLSLTKGAEVKGCRFFQLDRMFVTAAGGKIDVHSYAIDMEVDDLDRYSNKSKVKVLASVNTANQAVLCVACHNSFPSGVIFYGGSNKSVGVYDVCEERNVVQLDAPHERPVHTVFLPSSSHHAGVSQNALELFGTASSDGVVKIWDLRCPGAAVRAFASHVNKVHTVGAAFSPCLRHLATGSEDRCTYLYDMGTAKVIAKPNTHTDVVSDVAFNPIHPQLAAVGHDGAIRFLAGQ